MSDYNEHLISQAGGDGEPMARRVQITIVTDRIGDRAADIQDIQFTNVPLERLQRAMDLLNDDTAPTPEQVIKDALNKAYGRHCATSTASYEGDWQTKDFTLTELYGWYDGQPVSDRVINCRECGGAVSYDHETLDKHLEWHNKLLP